MLCVLSPAKTLDFSSTLSTKKHTEPRMLSQTARLIEVLRTKSVADLQALMGVSEEIATLNLTRVQRYELEHTPANARPALLAFAGDVYRSLDARSLDAHSLTEAQKTVRILSGLYGVLRPLDLIQPYRLEMGVPLATMRGKNLYQWWGDQITEALRCDIADSPGANVLVNLASAEYARVIHPELLDCKIVAPRFEDRDADGVPRVVGVHAKRARGAMARWLVQHRVRSAARIADFNELGYRYDESASDKDHPVFVR